MKIVIEHIRKNSFVSSIKKILNQKKKSDQLIFKSQCICNYYDEEKSLMKSVWNIQADSDEAVFRQLLADFANDVHKFKPKKVLIDAVETQQLAPDMVCTLAPDVFLRIDRNRKLQKIAFIMSRNIFVTRSFDFLSFQLSGVKFQLLFFNKETIAYDWLSEQVEPKNKSRNVFQTVCRAWNFACRA